jgi:prepilin-type N-terminal cleavage/methylation domain-containing protein
MRKNEKGFTLVELIVVIAIVAILAAVGIIGYTQFIQNARDTKAKSELDQVVNLLYADALVDGIKLTTGEEGSEVEVKVVTAKDGKLTFVANTSADEDEPNGLTEDLFKKLIQIYAEGLEGTFTLSKNTLKYTVGDGNGEVNVNFDVDDVEYEAKYEAE